MAQLFFCKHGLSKRVPRALGWGQETHRGPSVYGKSQRRRLGGADGDWGAALMWEPMCLATLDWVISGRVLPGSPNS